MRLPTALDLDAGGLSREEGDRVPLRDDTLCLCRDMLAFTAEGKSAAPLLSLFSLPLWCLAGLQGPVAFGCQPQHPHGLVTGLSGSSPVPVFFVYCLP